MAWTVYAEQPGLTPVQEQVPDEIAAIVRMRELAMEGYDAGAWPTDTPDN
jgi:hypothetical protein